MRRLNADCDGLAGADGDDRADETVQRDIPTQPWTAPRVGPPVVDGFPEWLEGRKYRRDQELNRGGMGVVYRYRDTRLDRLVAVKAISPERSHDPDWRDRFKAEAKLVASLNHDNIAKIYDLVENDGVDYLILEYVPGNNLARELARDKLSIEKALQTALQVAGAIAAGHAHHVIHGDIKPGNIMITPDGQVKLLDYGLAQQRARSTAAPLTGSLHDPLRPRVVHGTPGYMSPEHERGDVIDERADVWAFGCVLYECLTARATFPARRTGDGPPAPDWRGLPPRTPRSVRRLLERCLEPDSGRRLADLNEACETLRPFLDGSSADPRGIRNNLATRLASFVSRTGELERLRPLLESTPVLTLVGPGGAGKTRLAHELAADVLTDDNVRQRPRYPDGVWFVKLEPLAEPELVAQAVATTLGIADAPRDEPMASMLRVVADHLRSAAAMLIMDNCEHVLDGCRELVEVLRAECPNVSVLATSREGLGINGEQTYPVPALSFPDDGEADVDAYEAVRLFVLRAKLSWPDFRLTDQNRPLVAQICRRLEGIPFAIELAAARVRMGVEQLATRLFDIMDRQALQSSIEMSVRLLTRPERTLLGRLSVFRGGWTLETAEKVCGDDADGTIGKRPVIQLLGQLADRSLVRYEERGDRARYHLLETMRAYSAEKLLRSPADEAVRARHLEVFADLADEADSNFSGDQAADWLDRLETEHDNVRAALDWSLRDGVDPGLGVRMVAAMHMFWNVRGYSSEGRAWIDAALARRPDVRDVLQMKACNAGGTVAGRQGDFAAASARYHEALDIARDLADRNRAAGILTNLGLLTYAHGTMAEARTHHEASLELYRTLGDSVGVACAQLNLVDVAKSERRFDEARELIDACLPVFRERSDSQRIAAALHDLGEITYYRGDFDTALGSFKESLGVSQVLGDRAVIASSILWIGITCHDRGSYEDAARLFAASETVRETVEAPVAMFASAQYEQALRAVREHLDASVFDAAWTAGSALTSEEAAAYALSR